MRTSYSRRELYAFGEPIGDSATYRKADGGLVLGDGGGGGGTPATQTQISDLPGWARGYAQENLARGQALTDINQNPYQAYGGERIAGLSGLQQQAMSSVASPEAFGKSVQGYMSPYMQNVVDIQKREAGRQSGMLGAQQQAKATSAGAFGGYRQGIESAERERNLMQQMNDIQAQGSQSAYNAATQQANTAIGQQTQLGALQQQQAQRPLDLAYQDFLTQKNYPYQQLSYMNNLIRGIPMGMSSQSQVYQGSPSTLQTLGALGMGAYGAKQLGMIGGAKEGGLMQSYADGGMTVMEKFNSPEALLPDMDMLNEDQLRAIIAAPATPAEKEAAQRELAMRASEQQGLASAYNQVPYDVRANMVRAAGGGIIAFAQPTSANNYSLVSSEDDDGSEAGQQVLPTRIADPALQAQLNKRGLSIADYLMNPTAYKAPTSAERLAYMKDYAKEISDAAGESPSAGMRRYIQEQREALGKEREEAKGLAALQAIPAILQPGGFIRGAGAAAASIGGSMAEANKMQRAAKNQFAQMEFNLADADRKERMGLHRDARAAFDKSEENKIAGLKLDREAKAAAGNVIGKLAQANRVTGAGAGAGGAKLPQVDRQAAVLSDQIAALESSNPNDPKLPLLRKQLEGRLKIISTGKDVGPQRAELMAGQIFSRASESVQKTVRSQALMDDEWRNAMANGDSAGMAAALDRLTEAQMKRQGVTNPQGGPSAGSRRPPPPPGFNPVQ